MLSELSNLFPLGTALQLLYVRDGVQPATSITVDEKGLNRLIAYCTVNDLHFMSYEFSAKGKHAYKVLVGRNRSELDVAKIFYRHGMESEMRQVLGVPKCCANSKHESHGSVVRASEGFEFPKENNVLAAPVLGFLPCKLDCKEAAREGAKRLRCIRDYDPEAYRKILASLKSIVLWREPPIFLKGLVKAKKLTIYHDVESEWNDDLAKLAMNNMKVQVHSKGNVTLGSTPVDNIIALVFS